MEFCSKCGSYMKKTKNGLLCRKCENVIPLEDEMQLDVTKKTERSKSIYIIGRKKDDEHEISHVCPKCGNGEAFRWFSRVSGEHAGIRRERTVEHFKCAKCSHSWSKTS